MVKLKELGIRIISVQKTVHSLLSLDTKIDIVKTLIRKILEIIPGKVLIHFSGGKDSLVMLHITSQVIKEFSFERDRFLVIHCDTGCHPPGTLDYVKSICNELGYKLIVVPPVVSIWWIFRKFGFPGREEYCARYVRHTFPCCYLLKKIPSVIYTEIDSEVTIEFLGIRAYGEALRRNLTVMERGILFISKQEHNIKRTRPIIRVFPIAYFSNRDVVEYIMKFRLKPHWIYEKLGFNFRLGCMPCTANPDLDKYLSKVNPKLLMFVKEKIKEWGFECEKWKTVTQPFLNKIGKFISKNLKERKWKCLNDAIHDIKKFLYREFGS